MRDCMHRLVLSFLIVSLVASASLARADGRPKILGIAYVKVFVSDLEKSKEFYSLVSRSIPEPKTPCEWCEKAPISAVNREIGAVELEVIRSSAPANLLKEVAFRTNDVARLREYLQKRHLLPTKLTKCGENLCFTVLDPGQHQIIFVQISGHLSSESEITGAYAAGSPRLPIIHAGFVVRDRAAMDKFYKDILGFREYWHGGMKDNETDWVDMQVPDGTDWIEYMLNVPANADKKLLGVMNHIAIGVPDIHTAQKQLIENGWKPAEEPQIGRDGKWQLNLYDPDQTRVEFMEFKPSNEPCCSPYTGPHPGPKP